MQIMTSSKRWRPRATALATLALLSSCASPAPNALAKYQPPPAGMPAAVIDAGHGQAWSVDGAETRSFAKTVRLVPGEHRVGLNCLSFEIVGAEVLSYNRWRGS